MLRTSRRQRVGDRWGHTVVVRADSLPPDAARPGITAGIVLGCCAQIVVSAIDMVTRVM
jgi:hypothetical protein